MDFLIGLLAFIFVLGLIIAVHEFGHFFFARRAGILCREFAFGMGPILWKKKKGETLYSLRAFPIGGFCAIAGEEFEGDPLKKSRRVKLQIENGVVKGIYLNANDTAIDYPVHDIINYDLFDRDETGNLFLETRSEGGEFHYYPVDPQAMIYEPKIEYQIAPYNRTLGSKSKRARAMVMFGGPLMNFLLALLVFFIAGLIRGFPSSSNIVDFPKKFPDNELLPPAYEAGLRDGDRISYLKSGDLEKEVESWDDISEFMSSYTNSAYTTPIELTYVRGGETETITVRPYVILNSIELVGVFVENGIEIIKIEELNERIAMNVGLEENDIIVAVTDAEGKTYTGISGIYAALKNYRGSHKENALNMLTITVLRDSVETEIKVQPYSQKVMETAQRDAVDVMLGINPQYKFHFGKSIIYSFQNTGHSFTSVFNSIKLLITEESVTLEAMSGPVGIFGITKETASYGFTNLLHLLGLLSVNVGLLNLFPIPALDGGRLVFLGYEAITKKKPSPKVETALISITMILLLGLMIIVTFNDVLKLFR